MWFTLQVNQNTTNQITLRLRAVRHFLFSFCFVSLFLLAFFFLKRSIITPECFGLFLSFFWSTTTEGWELKKTNSLICLWLIQQNCLPWGRPGGRTSQSVLFGLNQELLIRFLSLSATALVSGRRQPIAFELRETNLNAINQQIQHFQATTCALTHVPTPSQCWWLTLSDGKPRFKPIVCQSHHLLFICCVSTQTIRTHTHKKKSWQTIKNFWISSLPPVTLPYPARTHTYL